MNPHEVMPLHTDPESFVFYGKRQRFKQQRAKRNEEGTFSEVTESLQSADPSVRSDVGK